MKVLLGFFYCALTALHCSGLQLENGLFDAALLGDALNASIAKVNEQSFGPNLFAVVWSAVKSAGFLDEDTSSLILEFRIQETTCDKDSGSDPASCMLKRGRYVQTASCKSLVEVSEEHVVGVYVRCQREDSSSSSSSSSSSEEVSWGRQMNNRRRSNGNPMSRHYSQTSQTGKRKTMNQKTQRRQPQPRSWHQFE